MSTLILRDISVFTIDGVDRTAWLAPSAALQNRVRPSGRFEIARRSVNPIEALFLPEDDAVFRDLGIEPPAVCYPSQEAAWLAAYFGG